MLRLLKSSIRFIFWAGLVLVILVVVINLIIYIFSKRYTYKNVADINEAPTAIILGAALLRNGTLSPIFKSRVDKALELYKAKKVSKILASGDNSTVAHNEVDAVRNYLLTKAIPDQDIFLDHAGFDTYSTMYRARDIFKVSSVIIVTQSFHLPRAIFIARMLGLDAQGISADRSPGNIHNYIREVFANEKALIDLVLHREPKYLGNTIPIPNKGAKTQ